MNRIIIAVFILSLFLRGVFASPLNGPISKGKSHTHTKKVLFPSRLGQSGNPSYRLYLKEKQPGINDESNELDSSLLPQVLTIKNGSKAASLHGGFQIRSKLRLEGNYSDIEKVSSASFQDREDYARIVKTTSLGLAYPLTSKLTLNGRYGVVKQQGLEVEPPTPSVGATYRFSTSTSISLSYRQPQQQMDDKTSAELKIHF